MNNKAKRFIIEEHPVFAVFLYLFLSFLIQFITGAPLYASCILNLIAYVYTFGIRHIRPVKKPFYRKMVYFLCLCCSMFFIISSYMWSKWYMVNIADSFSLGYTQIMRNANIYIYMVAVLFAAPLGEESFFRYIMMNGIRSSLCGHKTFQFPCSILISAFVFAFMHGTGVHLVSGFFAGIAFGSVFAVTGRLWVSILLHTIYNFGAFFIDVPSSLALCIVFSIISVAFFSLMVYNVFHQTDISP